MRSKRVAALALAALMALALIGCGAKADKDKEEAGDMIIQPAQLTEEETALAQLLGLGMESYHIFEFQAGGAKTLQLNTYELADGKWSRIQGGSAELSEEDGRIALTFGKMTDGVRLAFHTGTQIMSITVQPELWDDVSAMTFATSGLGESRAIELEEEIPLAVQIVTSRSEIRSYDVSYFGMPREYAKHGYEHVYAITVLFSQKSLAELSQDVPSATPGDALEPSAEPSPES